MFNVKVISYSIIGQLGVGSWHVLAIDLAPDMLEIGARVARDAGLRNIETRVMDAQMPVDDQRKAWEEVEAVLVKYERSGRFEVEHRVMVAGGSSM